MQDQHQHVVLFVIHAFGGHPRKFWYDRFAKAVTAMNPHVVVEVLRMTDSHTPRIEAWVMDITRAVQRVRRNESVVSEDPPVIYLVGHSVGCQAILHFLAHPDSQQLLSQHVRLGGCLCVAAWFEVVDPWETIEPWCTTAIDDEAVQRSLHLAAAPLRVFISDNDRYTPDYQANTASWQERFGAYVEVLPGRGHFSGRNQPELLSAMLKMLPSL